MKARASIGVAFAMLVAAIVPAGAQSASAQAEILFRQGRDLMKAGKYADACKAFETSQRLDPKVTTLLNLADCREQNGQLATALAAFSDAEKAAKAGGAKTQSLVKTAASHAAKLQGRLSTLTITVPSEGRIAGLALTRNAAPIDPATWGVALPVDGGTYEIIARAPGHESWTATVRVKAEGDAKTVDLPPLAASSEPHPIAKPQPPEPAPAPEPEAPEEDHPAPRRSRALPIAVGVGAVALAGGALTLELWARSTYSDSLSSPDPNQQIDLWHSANLKRYVADGMLGASVATAGVAIWLWVRNRGEKPARMAIAPLVSPQTMGFAFGGAW